MKVLMEIGAWSGFCGYFYNADDEKDITMNNEYNCKHSECGHIELGVGGCHAGACPFGYEADETDCINFGVEYEEAAYIVVDIPEEDYCEDCMEIQKNVPQMADTAKIKLELFVASNDEFQKFKNAIADGLDNTLAIMCHGDIHYELYAENGKLNLYTSEKNDDGDFETVDKTYASEYVDDVEDLEAFVQKLIRLFL